MYWVTGEIKCIALYCIQGSGIINYPWKVWVFIMPGGLTLKTGYQLWGLPLFHLVNHFWCYLVWKGTNSVLISFIQYSKIKQNCKIEDQIQEWLEIYSSVVTGILYVQTCLFLAHLIWIPRYFALLDFDKLTQFWSLRSNKNKFRCCLCRFSGLF